LLDIDCNLIQHELFQQEKRQDLFHFVSPIIAFLIIFWVSTKDKLKIKTLDELLAKSGLRTLMRVVKVPKVEKKKDTAIEMSNSINNNNDKISASDSRISSISTA